MKGDPLNHEFEEHTAKTMVYICPKCHHCECQAAPFKKHLERHKDLDRTAPLTCYVKGPVPAYDWLNGCRLCDFRHYNAAGVVSHVRDIHPDPDAPFGPHMQPETVFPRASAALKTEVTQLDDVMEAVLRETDGLRKEQKRRQREPETPGVRHEVTLRGDLFSEAGEAFTHVYVEHMIAAGQYHVSKGVQQLEVTVAHHGASPMFRISSEAISPRNPAHHELSGMLHLARGPPVVWYVLSVGGYPVKGCWCLKTLVGESVCQITFNPDMTLM